MVWTCDESKEHWQTPPFIWFGHATRARNTGKLHRSYGLDMRREQGTLANSTVHMVWTCDESKEHWQTPPFIWFGHATRARHTGKLHRSYGLDMRREQGTLANSTVHMVWTCDESKEHWQTPPFIWFGHATRARHTGKLHRSYGLDMRREQGTLANYTVHMVWTCDESKAHWQTPPFIWFGHATRARHTGKLHRSYGLDMRREQGTLANSTVHTVWTCDESKAHWQTPPFIWFGHATRARHTGKLHRSYGLDMRREQGTLANSTVHMVWTCDESKAHWQTPPFIWFGHATRARHTGKLHRSYGLDMRREQGTLANSTVYMVWTCDESKAHWQTPPFIWFGHATRARHTGKLHRSYGLDMRREQGTLANSTVHMVWTCDESKAHWANSTVQGKVDGHISRRRPT